MHKGVKICTPANSERPELTAGDEINKSFVS